MRRTLTPLLAAVLLSIALAAPASADLGSKVVKDFGDDGALNACIYSAAELKLIKSLIANDTDAYAPDLRSAIDAMFEQRAQGVCNNKREPGGAGQGSAGAAGSGGSTGSGGSSGSGGGGSGTPSPGGSGSGTPGVAQPAPAPGAQPTAAPLISNDAISDVARSSDEGDTPPFPLLALAALMALMALGTIVYGALRFTGWEPAWASRARHATAEAGWRASSTWAEFTDFVRFGR